MWFRIILGKEIKQVCKHIYSLLFFQCPNTTELAHYKHFLICMCNCFSKDVKSTNCTKSETCDLCSFVFFL